MFPYKELQQSLLHLMLPSPKCPNKSVFIKVLKKKKTLKPLPLTPYFNNIKMFQKIR